MITNYRWRKFPWMIVGEDNKDPDVQLREEAEEYLRKLHQPFELPAAKPVVVFVGGALDSQHESMRRVFDSYRNTSPVDSYPPFDQDKLYFYFDESNQARAEMAILEKVFARPDTLVAVVGHSYGGDTAYKIVRNLSQHGLDVSLLVTLDPVSNLGRFTPDLPEPARYTKWVNFYVDKSVVSTVGGQWGRQENALSLHVAGAAHGDADKLFYWMAKPWQFIHFNMRPAPSTEAALLQRRRYYEELKNRSNAPQKRTRVR